jgi:23S rRNA (guanosine2251-2'-O)-methyltransferase
MTGRPPYRAKPGGPRRDDRDGPRAGGRDGKRSGGRPGGRHGGRQGGRQGAGGGDGPAMLYGWHTVKAALENPNRHIRKLYATEGAMRRLTEDGVTSRVAPELVQPEILDRRLGPEAVHQGLLAEVDELDGPQVEDLSEGLVIVLDQITDPHNVGAIFRTAAAFAAAAVVTTQRHSPQAGGVLAKSASGALEHVPLVTVPNLARGLEAMKDAGFLLVGLDSAGESDLAALPLHAPMALVLGAEGQGLRRLTRENCDYLARLDMPGTIKSLNVSNAAALAMYVASQKIKG